MFVAQVSGEEGGGEETKYCRAQRSVFKLRLVKGCSSVAQPIAATWAVIPTIVPENWIRNEATAIDTPLQQHTPAATHPASLLAARGTGNTGYAHHPLLNSPYQKKNVLSDLPARDN